jgi:hypothetical protein
MAKARSRPYAVQLACTFITLMPMATYSEGSKEEKFARDALSSKAHGDSRKQSALCVVQHGASLNSAGRLKLSFRCITGGLHNSTPSASCGSSSLRLARGNRGRCSAQAQKNSVPPCCTGRPTHRSRRKSARLPTARSEVQAYLDHIWKGKLENLTASSPSNSYLLWINRTLLMYAHRTRCVVWSHVVCGGHTLASWIALSHFRDIMCIMCSGFTGPLADTGQPCRPADRDTADTFALSSSRFEWRCNYGTLCCTARIAATRRC